MDGTSSSNVSASAAHWLPNSWDTFPGGSASQPHVGFRADKALSMFPTLRWHIDPHEIPVQRKPHSRIKVHQRLETGQGTCRGCVHHWNALAIPTAAGQFGAPATEIRRSVRGSLDGDAPEAYDAAAAPSDAGGGSARRSRQGAGCRRSDVASGKAAVGAAAPARQVLATFRFPVVAPKSICCSRVKSSGSPDRKRVH